MTPEVWAALAALATVAGAVLKAVLAARAKKKEPYEQKQEIRQAVAGGDADAVSAELDRLRETLARRRAQRKPNDPA